MAHMVGNHDVTRFLSEAAGQVEGARDQAWRAPPPVPDDPLPYRRMLLAQTFALTTPGAPVIYYGDELGLPGVGDPDNRRAMRFGGERSANERWLAARVGRLGRLRSCLPSLRRGALRVLHAEDERLAWLREGAWPAVVVLARQTEADAASLELELPAEVPDVDFVDVLSGQRVPRTERGLAPLALTPHRALVLVPATHRCAAEGAP